MHANQIQDWKKQLLVKAVQIFGAKHAGEGTGEAILQRLHAKIGELTMGRDFLAKALSHDR